MIFYLFLKTKRYQTKANKNDFFKLQILIKLIFLSLILQVLNVYKLTSKSCKLETLCITYLKQSDKSSQGID